MFVYQYKILFPTSLPQPPSLLQLYVVSSETVAGIQPHETFQQPTLKTICLKFEQARKILTEELSIWLLIRIDIKTNSIVNMRYVGSKPHERQPTDGLVASRSQDVQNKIMNSGMLIWFL